MNLSKLLLVWMAFLLIFSCAQEITEKKVSLTEQQSEAQLSLQNAIAPELQAKCGKPQNSVSGEEALAIVQQLYAYFFAGDVASMMALMADDVTWTHQGPSNELMPYYGAFTGHEGFLQWVIALSSSTIVNQFEIRYMIADGNRVDVSVLEGAIMFASSNNLAIENFHSFVINDEGKLQSALIYSESQTVINTLNGEPGETYITPYEVTSYDITNLKNQHFYKAKAAIATAFMNCGNNHGIKGLVANDVLISAGGDEEIVPFAGQFTGKAGAAEFIESLSTEADIEIKEIISQYNKAIVHCQLSGNTEDYNCDLKITYQFDEQGKIKNIYLFFDTGSVSIAYQ